MSSTKSSNTASKKQPQNAAPPEVGSREWMEAMSELHEGIIFALGYDHCIIGICERFGCAPFVIYDKDKIINTIVREIREGDKVSTEREVYLDAVEYFNFNIIGAYVGEHTPGFVTT